jgi:flavin reductase ActVB
LSSSGGPAPSRRELRAAFGAFATGVVIVTTRDATVSDWGITATAFTPLSEDPPLVLVCLSTAAGSTAAFEQSERFAVSLLRPEHEDLAERFATGRPDKFVLGGFEPLTSGLRAVTGALAVLECRTGEVHPGGDHAIMIGHVEAARCSPGPALVYFRREFAALD